MKQLYLHPEELGELKFDTQTCRLFAFNESETLSAHVSIGPIELRKLAFRLLALADEVSALNSDDGGGPF